MPLPNRPESRGSLSWKSSQSRSFPVLLKVLVASILAGLDPVSAGSLSGRILDTAGKPVPGAAITLDQSGISVVTDAQGRFSLTTTGFGHSYSDTDPDRSLIPFPDPGAGQVLAFSGRGREEIEFRDGHFDFGGRSLEKPVSKSFLTAGRHGMGAAKRAAWNDTLAIGKSAYLTRRVVPAGPDAAMGDIVLYPAFTGTPDKFLGFDQYHFTLEGKPCLVVVPKKPRAGNPWIWRTYFWNHKPLFDSIMCANGYYLAFMDAPNLFGSPTAMSLMDSFHAHLVGKYGLSKKANLLGISRGGLYVYNWAARNLDMVSTIYSDGAVMDFVSWPCGGYGTGTGSAGDWTLLKAEYGFGSDAAAKAYRGNPYQNMKPLALAKIPIIHVYGETDMVVPPMENGLRANDSLKAYGWRMRLLAKPNTGHTHGVTAADGGLPGQLDTLVRFVLGNTSY
ncbi:MAG: Alpha/beta hydrolase family protein [Fibrobacteres bacterium]|nr:Alpha/beta hydrolase family protein [Fibrobacterota bacterium]